MKRAIMYARVSGDDRKNDSRNLEGQIEMCQVYARKQGYEIIAELSEDDSGASGASFELPMLNQVREMAQSGDFDVLVVREIDRLSRKLAKQLIVEEELKSFGVQIEYVLGDYPNTPEGNFMKHVRATVAEFEREKINERMVRGRRQKIRSGSVLTSGRTAYGYRPGVENGKSILIIVESEAKVIRMIFRWYTIGGEGGGPISMRAIARRLTELSIPTYSDLYPHLTGTRNTPGVWRQNTVRKILTNKTYIGVWTYGQTSQLGPLTVEVPAIVSQETWNIAQERRKKNKQRARRNRKHQYLLSGHIRCGHCRSAMAGGTFYPEGKRYQYYTCLIKRSPKDHEGTCDLPYFRVEYTDSEVWEWVKSVMFDPELREKGWEAYKIEQEMANAPIRDRLLIVGGLIADHKKQYERLIDLFVKGDIPQDMLTERKNRLEVSIQALTQEQKELESNMLSNELTHEQLMEIKESLEMLAEELTAQEEGYEIKRQILDILDVSVRCTVEDDEKIIYARCVLTGKDFAVVNNAICARCRCKNLHSQRPG